MTRCPGRFAFLIPALAVSSLVACNTNTDSGRYANLVTQVFSRTKVARDQAAAVPFASIGIKLGSGNEALMVLGANQFGRQEWYSGTQMIATREGRIVQTAGLPFDLSRLDVRGPVGGIDLQIGAPKAGTQYALILDFQDLKLFGAIAECRTRDAGEAFIDILGTRLRTRHLIESCQMQLIDWSFENEYWVDPDTAFIWRSSQYVHPKLSRLTFEVLRPAQTMP
jgi:hypothetical protein